MRGSTKRYGWWLMTVVRWGLSIAVFSAIYAYLALYIWTQLSPYPLFPNLYTWSVVLFFGAIGALLCPVCRFKQGYSGIAVTGLLAWTMLVGSDYAEAKWLLPSRIEDSESVRVRMFMSHDDRERGGWFYFELKDPEARRRVAQRIRALRMRPAFGMSLFSSLMESSHMCLGDVVFFFDGNRVFANDYEFSHGNELYVGDASILAVNEQDYMELVSMMKDAVGDQPGRHIYNDE